MTETNAIYNAAEELYLAGLAVIPLGAKSKRPDGEALPKDEHGQPTWKPYQKRRADASERFAWFGDHAERNVGVVCGWVSGDGNGRSLVVLDFDEPGAYEAFARANLELVKSTWVVRSSKGYHVYLRAPGKVQTTKMPGGDLKGEGGYVVAPPSIHPDGPAYTWANRTPEIAEVDDLAALIQAETSERKAAEIPDRIPSGERNSTLTSLAGTMRRRGASTAEILAALRVANAERCDPPLPSTEVERIAQSVGRYPPVTPAPHAQAATPTTTHLLHQTDLGNAERLVARHGAELRYCHPWARWLAWDGRRWAIDDAGEVKRRAKETTRAIYAEAAQLADESVRKERAKWAMRSENRTRLDAMTYLAQSETGIPVTPDELDAGPWLLTCNNGTLDLRTGKLRPHAQTDLITKLAPVDYDPNAQAPTWQAFLQRIMAENETLTAFLRRAVGYSLTGDTGERALFFLHGAGANGKSTFLETIRAMAGDYGLRTPTETLMTKRSGAIPNDVARLKGARLVTAAESDEGKRLAEALIKDLTGGDTIAARFMRAEWFDFRPQCKIWLATNHKPTIKGTDKAIWDRIKLIPFEVIIPDEEQDRRLIERLKAELPGILAWAVRGCLEWYQDGLGIPDVVTTATGRYRDEMDVLGAFIADRCELTPTASETAKALYNGYKDWCEANGEKSVSKRAFGLRLAERGLDRYSDGKARSWLGIELVEMDFTDATDTY